MRPENTLLAFDHGLSLGADGLEFDVHLSRDGVVVVHHDADAGAHDERPWPDRGADGRRARRAWMPATISVRLRRMIIAGFGETACAASLSRAGRGVPTLSEVLERYPAASLIIELKVNDPVLAHRAIDEVRAAGALERVAVGSFGTRVLRAARAYEPRILTGASREETRLALYRSWIRWPVRHPPNDAFQVPEGPARRASCRRVSCEHAHEAGVAVQVWTVNDDRRHAAPARLGRRRPDQRSPGHVAVERSVRGRHAT